MHTEAIERWLHDHTFGQDEKKPGERKTLFVIVITALTMAVEIVAGIAFGSMALLADGLHMASHASALAISAFAYYYTRRHARDVRFNFGTGKVNSLAAFASAVMLILFALVMVGESIQRFFSPVAINFLQAIFVAVVGLFVNGVCLVILRGRDHSHGQVKHEHAGHASGDHEHQRVEARSQDHNLWSAYLHVLADATTSFLAIFALLAGKYLGQVWLDPFMGIVGGALVVRWSAGLLHSSARVLLDLQVAGEVRNAITRAIEAESDTRVCDLHVWAVGPGIFAAEIGVVTSEPKEPEHYAHLASRGMPLAHATVEVRRCPSASTSGRDTPLEYP